MLFGYGECNHVAIIKTQPCLDIDIHKNILFLHIGSLVAVQHKDGWPYMHVIVIGMDLRIFIVEATKYEYQRWSTSSPRPVAI